MYYGTFETEDAVDKLNSMNIPCCEVFLQTFSEYSSRFGQLIRERLGSMQAVSMHVRMQHYQTDLLARSPRLRADSFDWFNRSLDAGAAFGAGIYVYHGPQVVRGERHNMERWGEGLAHARSLAAERNIDFCWETVSWCTLNAPDRVTEARRICPDMGFVLDIKQALETGYTPFEYIEAMGPNLRHVHAMDYDEQGNYALPGKGSFDFPKLATVLRECGYQGDIILEPYEEQARQDTKILESLMYLRDLFEGTKV